MSKFAKFMKANKTVKENSFYAATKSLTDDDGNALVWEFRHITSKENEAIRDDCTKEIPVVGKANLYRDKINSGLYLQKLIAASVVTPDLYDKELQDSYGVMTPEELLMAMMDDPGEYSDLAAFVKKLQGFTSLEDKAQEAKN